MALVNPKRPRAVEEPEEMPAWLLFISGMVMAFFLGSMAWMFILEVWS